MPTTMSTTTVGLLALLAFAWMFFMFFYILRKQSKIKAEAKDKKLIIIPRKDGEVDFQLVPIHNGQTYSTVTTPEGKKRKLRAAVKPQKAFNTLWPLNQRKIYQVPMKVYFIPEGWGEAWSPFNKEPIFTDEYLANLQDEAFSRAMVARGEEIKEELEERRKPKKKMPKNLWIIIGGILIFLVVLGFALSSSGGNIKWW